MKLLYHSDVLDKNFDTEAELNAAEKDYEEKIAALKAEEVAKKQAELEAKAERKKAAEAIEDARKVMVAAQREYKRLLEEFIHKYKTYRYSTDDVRDIPSLFASFFDF